MKLTITEMHFVPLSKQVQGTTYHMKISKLSRSLSCKSGMQRESGLLTCKPDFNN